MRFTSLFVAATVAAVPAHAFIAWSGNSCNGAKGADVPCDDACRQFTTRHSFVAGQSAACVSFYTTNNCSGDRFFFYDQGPQCTNVNTGTPINSFRCNLGARNCK